MEEKVVTSGQENPGTEEEKNQQKFDINKVPREELVNALSQLNQQCKGLARQNEELKMRLQQVDGIETRLHYLFKILENKFAFEEDYIIEVADEIKDIMTIKEEPKDNNESEPKQ